MALSIVTPQNSFVRWSENDTFIDCIHGERVFCLPVVNSDDYAFQFVIEGDTIEEVDQLCDIGNTQISLGIIFDCTDEDFTLIFPDNPERFRISDKQVLYNWSYGFPLFDTEVAMNQCFKIRIEVGVYGSTTTFCSNCFQRIDEECITSVIEYGNEDNAFGFNYCYSATEDEEDLSCEPMFVTFNNQSTLTLPYTASMLAKYGNVPSIQTWIYNEAGELINMGITASLDGYPPNNMIWDFGGNASGVIRIGP